MGATKKHLQHHPHQKLLVIANGLGGALFFFEPLVARFVAKGWAVVTWDYRGLFKSGVPLRQRRLAVPEHAEDLRELLDTLGRAEADVFLGWSTGVQVGMLCNVRVCCFDACLPRRLVLGSGGSVVPVSSPACLRVDGGGNCVDAGAAGGLGVCCTSP